MLLWCYLQRAILAIFQTALDYRSPFHDNCVIIRTIYPVLALYLIAGFKLATGANTWIYLLLEVLLMGVLGIEGSVKLEKLQYKSLFSKKQKEMLKPYQRVSGRQSLPPLVIGLLAVSVKGKGWIFCCCCCSVIIRSELKGFIF